MDNEIKTIAPRICPHCGEQIFVEFKMLPPSISGVYSPADVALAKADVIKKIIDLHLPVEKQQEVMAWVNTPETIFGPSEVEPIIESLKNDNT
jgi:hypothetical protein